MKISFDPVDIEMMRLRARLTPGQLIQTLLDSHRIVVGIKRGRLKNQYPYLSDQEINLKVIEEIELAKRLPPTPF